MELLTDNDPAYRSGVFLHSLQSIEHCVFALDAPTLLPEMALPRGVADR